MTATLVNDLLHLKIQPVRSLSAHSYIHPTTAMSYGPRDRTKWMEEGDEKMDSFERPFILFDDDCLELTRRPTVPFFFLVSISL